MSSDRIVNYVLRPAKNIERKMIRDLLSRLFPFGGTESYRYIGFGAKYFADFALFHRCLHIDDMISIEGGAFSQKVYEFNKPFKCINMMYGTSNEVLPKLKYDKKVIVWLDNDKNLSKSVLSDLCTIISRSLSGSLIIVTYKSDPPKIDQLKKKYNTGDTHGLIRRALVEQLGEEYIPVGIIEDGLSKWTNYSRVLAKIIKNSVDEILSSINMGKDENQVKHCQQLMYFDYKDNAEMSTLVYIVHNSCDRIKIDECHFETFDFVRQNLEPYKIDVPCFTYKEMSSLYANMPLDIAQIDTSGIDLEIFPREDVLRFAKFYKYFPNFLETDFI